ncbi:hypothetical protein HMPREF0372_03986 [Flavonifractor plautii ATCC 29863]|uniref:Uncharacterized protein n=1 Tax=Flavonifractor plautii ATCC 29863 TaxID=411475 RepID=G9YWR8_FLAPL|nr:hypothetical protein HMPREF0372_03986 [Flavonifractor plautii ATCC 29863]
MLIFRRAQRLNSTQKCPATSSLPVKPSVSGFTGKVRSKGAA